MLALKTFRQPWIQVGTIDATAAGSDSALGVAERDYTTNKDLDNVVCKEVPANINTLEVAFILTTNNHDVDIDVWCGRLKNKEAEMARVCTLDVICGQQDFNDSTHHYADTINISNNQWLKTVSAIEPGTDHMARLIFDLCGYDLVLFHGYGTFDGDCIVEISGF